MQTKQKAASEKRYYSGFANLIPRVVNPTNEELSALIGYELDPDKKEPSYEGTTRNGEDYVKVVFWLQADTKEGQWFKHDFMLINKSVVSKESGKIQFVNQCGGQFGACYCDKQENLLSWFTEFQKGKKGAREKVGDKIVRQAIQGEANLYEFLNPWLDKVDWNSPESDILIDKDKAFRNITKFVKDEYQTSIDQYNKYDNETDPKVKSELLKDVQTRPLTALAYVEVDKADPDKLYQKVYSGFLSGWKIKDIRLAVNSGNWNGKGDELKRYLEQLQGPHGCKGMYQLTMLEPLDTSSFQEATNVVFIDKSKEEVDISY